MINGVGLIRLGPHACTVHANSIVMVCVAPARTASIVDRQGGAGADTFAFQRLMPPLDFAVRLRVERQSSDVCYTADADELLEVAGGELGPVVGDDAVRGLGVWAGSAQLADRFGSAVIERFGNTDPTVVQQGKTLWSMSFYKGALLFFQIAIATASYASVRGEKT